jgi:hypothetical protein
MKKHTELMGLKILHGKDVNFFKLIYIFIALNIKISAGIFIHID